MRRSFLFGVVLAVGALGCSPFASAQNYVYATGSPNWGMQIPVESGFINVSNGNVHLEIPIATQPQRGRLTLNERLVYDSRIWQIVPSGSSYQWEPTNVPSSSAGWTFNKGNETGQFEIWGNLNTDPCPNNGSENFTYYKYSFTWKDPSQTIHSFPVGTVQLTNSNCTWPNGQEPDQPTGVAYSDDTSNYFMSVTNYTTATIYDSSGNQVYPTPQDPNGNSFSSDSNGNLVDTIGRTPVLATTSGSQTYYDVLTIGGQRKRYTVTTGPVYVHTAFGQSDVSEYSGTLTAIQSIGLPDGSSYTFNYDSGTGSGHYGELQSITLPTGGTVSFGYTNYLDSYQNENRWISSYSGGKGSYSFTPSVVTQCTGSNKTGCQEQVAVEDGYGNDVKYLLTLNNGAWNSQVQYFNGGGGTPIATTATTYNFAASCASWDTQCIGSNYITASNTTTTLNDTGQQAQTVFGYNSENQITSIKEWDYYTGTPSSTPTRETDYQYNFSLSGTGAFLLSQVTRLDSGGNTVSQVVFGHDAYGNVNSVQTGVGSATITTTSQFDSSGMKTQDVDGRSNTVSYAYMCSDAYPNTITYPVVNGQTLKTTSTYDCSSGLLTATQDMNDVAVGASTNYSYFTSGTNLGKLQSISYPDGGSATYSYPSETEVDQSVAQTASVNVLTKKIKDAYGRQYQSISVAPEGSIVSETDYDASGRPYEQSNPHLSGTSKSTDGTTTTTFDVMGRPLSVQEPDGNSILYQYSGPSVTVTDELQHGKAYTYDAFHRLTKVLEPDPSGALNYETDYQYNALDELSRVDQWGGAYGSSSPGDRVRQFAYDSFGRKIAEYIPEDESPSAPASLTCAGASGSTWTKCFGYDNNGNLTSTKDNAGNTVTYHYDALNRMTWRILPGVSYGSGYDGFDENGVSMGLPATANVIGHLSRSSNEVNAAEDYSYDKMGRLSGESYCVPQSCNYTNTVGAAYDLAGNMTSLTYPDSRVVSYGYDAVNRLTSTQYQKWGSTSVGTSYYSASQFAPPGEPISAQLGNGVNVSSSFNSRLNLASLVYSNGSGTLFNKQYTWDKNGQNLTYITDNLTNTARQFNYDTLNRVTSAEDVEVTASAATATINIGGSEQSYTFNPCNGHGTCWQTIYDSGSYAIYVNGGSVGAVGWGQGSTPQSLASGLASAINSNQNGVVTASVSGSSVLLTSKITGAGGDYSISVSSPSWNSTYFSSPSFSVSAPSSLSGGEGVGSPVPGGLNETYTYDPFGNLDQSGNFSFSESYNSFNQMSSGFGYDGNGNVTADVYGHSLAYYADGLLSSVAGSGETYVYDADGERVEVHGSSISDFIFFGGSPLAILNGGAYSDLIYAGGALLAEVPGSQSATPMYRAVNHLGSLVGDPGSSGTMSGQIDYAPFGQTFTGSNSDPYGFTGLQYDSTTSMWHAEARQFSLQQGRWMSPDPYGGSYDFSDPQSLNRYSYVNGKPTWASDPSGMVMLATPGEAAGLCGASAGMCGWIFAGIGVADTVYDLGKLLGWWGSSFHGSLKPRPNAPWSEHMGGITPLGAPIGGLSPLAGIAGLNQAMGLPSTPGGCEFGACGPSVPSFLHGDSQFSTGQFCENHPTLCSLLGLGMVTAVDTGTSTDHPGLNNAPGVPVELTVACQQMCDKAAEACLGKAAYSWTLGFFGAASRGAFAGLMWRTVLGSRRAGQEKCALGRALCYAKTCGS